MNNKLFFSLFYILLKGGDILCSNAWICARIGKGRSGVQEGVCGRSEKMKNGYMDEAAMGVHSVIHQKSRSVSFHLHERRGKGKEGEGNRGERRGENKF
jgi:hypothetical protein